MSRDAISELLEWINSLSADLNGVSESLHQVSKCVAAMDLSNVSNAPLTSSERILLEDSFQNFFRGYQANTNREPNDLDMLAAFSWGVMRVEDLLASRREALGGSTYE